MQIPAVYPLNSIISEFLDVLYELQDLISIKTKADNWDLQEKKLLQSQKFNFLFAWEFAVTGPTVIKMKLFCDSVTNWLADNRFIFQTATMKQANKDGL